MNFNLDKASITTILSESLLVAISSIMKKVEIAKVKFANVKFFCHLIEFS